MVDREYRSLVGHPEFEYDDDPEGGSRELMNLVQVRVERTRKLGWFRHDDMPLGAHDLVVVETDDALLVTTRERAQDVKLVVDALKKRGDKGLV